MSAPNAQHKDDTWFVRTVRAELGLIRQYVRRRVPRDDVDDVVAEVFAAAWKHRAKLPDPARFWLLRTAWFHVSKYERQRRRQARLAGRVATLPDQHSPGPEEQLVLGAEVRAALAKLAPTDQEVLRLTAWEGLTAQEVAEVLACSHVTARARLSRARRKLARLLDKAEVALVSSPVTQQGETR